MDVSSIELAGVDVLDLVHRRGGRRRCCHRRVRPDAAGDGPARAAGGGPGVVDVEHQRHLRPEVSGQGRLDEGLLLGALVPVRRVGQREVCALVVHRDEAAAGVARLGPRRQRLQDAVAPGLGQAVAIERAGAGWCASLRRRAVAAAPRGWR